MLCCAFIRQIELQRAKKSEVEDLGGTLHLVTSKQHKLEREVQLLQEKLQEKVSPAQMAALSRHSRLAVAVAIAVS